VVLSSLGRAAGLASLGCLTRGGCFLELGRVDAVDATDVAQRRPDVRFHAVDLAGEIKRAPDQLAPVLRDVLADVQEDRLPRLPVTLVDRSTRALRRLQGARYPGKLVVTSAVTRGAVLVTGAFGGLGLLLAKHLVARGVRHLVLAGRRTPSEPQAAQVEALRAAGASVRVVRLDVTDQAAVERLLDEIDAGSAPLRGVVHAAGVVEDSLMANNDWPAFERVLAPKLAGAWALHQLTRDRPLDLFVLCSSAAGTLGNAGQAAHAAANASLDALAQHRQSLGLPAVSIAWGPWAGTGTAVTDAVERHLAARGLIALPPAEGVAAFSAALGAGLPHVVVGRMDWQRLLAGRRADPFFAEVAAPVPDRNEDRPVALAKAPPAGRAAIETQVRLALATVLGLPGPGSADPRRAFFDQGMDSLTSLEFRNRLQDGLGRPLAASIALDHPTVERLVAYLAGDDTEPDIDTMDEAALGALLDMRLDGALAR
jgi:NAD(P)-dependent dehydrogenase (short-subunit alcohol dehydrogenase family)